MTNKIEKRISAEEIGHEFLKYVLKENIRDKILSKIKDKIYLSAEIKDERYDKFLEQEYFTWAKRVDAPRDLIEEGWKCYLED